MCALASDSADHIDGVDCNERDEVKGTAGQCLEQQAGEAGRQRRRYLIEEKSAPSA